MRDLATIGGAPFVRADQRPMLAHPAPGLAASIAVAAFLLAAGSCLVGVGLVWTLPHGDAHAIDRGGKLYAAECASCHSALAEDQAARAKPDAGPPSLGAAGHAWQHSDAELATIIAQGLGQAVAPRGTSSMPNFAERLDRGEIDAILAYLKTSWPASIRAYQASLNLGVEAPPQALLSDPAWVFPGQCQSPPARSSQAKIGQ